MAVEKEVLEEQEAIEAEVVVNNENQEPEAQNKEWVNMTFPRGYVRPYERTFTDKETGEETTREYAYCKVPANTRANGVEIGGFTLSVPLTDKMRSQIANSESVSVGIHLDEEKGQNTKVTLFQGSGEDRKSLEIKPIVLAKALKDNREAYAKQKASEREAASGGEQTAEQPENSSEKAEKTDQTLAIGKTPDEVTKAARTRAGAGKTAEPVR